MVVFLIYVSQKKLAVSHRKAVKPGSLVFGIYYRTIIWLQSRILWNSLRSLSFDSHCDSYVITIQPLGLNWFYLLEWVLNTLMQSPIQFGYLSYWNNSARKIAFVLVMMTIGEFPTGQRRWTINLISCINKVSDQWKMLANIQGKERADEKSERLLLMEYSMSPDPEGEKRWFLLTVSLRISKKLMAWCGIRLKYNRGHVSVRYFLICFSCS